MLEELIHKAESELERIQRLRGYFDLEALSAKLAEVDEKANDPDIWSDQDRARKVMRARSELQQRLSSGEMLAEAADELEVLVEMARDGDEGLDAELRRTLGELSPKLDRVELEAKMTGEHDTSNAFVEIHPGAGGTESADWAQMLVRMYLKWCEKRGFDVEIMDEQPAEEAGIKGATLLIKGPYAYGNLKSENGVHRLVRISPFDQQSRRHTSFASAHVYPEVDDDFDLEIPEKDLRIDRYCSSGPGGQGVNTTYSAVRLVHEPTGVIVTCQNERSQIKNLASAMKVLKARLYELEMQKREEELDKLKGPKKDISWGNQIRSYVLQPYRMVKDLRTGHEVGATDRVLDGDLDGFIEAFLHWHAQGGEPVGGDVE
ncbi:MAG: peptide chain release factor 2 [Thermoanaerobaculales bacterium]|nr:peptide chain release factor 2 [Thermoanaerobaculales bacterium]